MVASMKKVRISKYTSSYTWNLQFNHGSVYAKSVDAIAVEDAKAIPFTTHISGIGP